MLLVVLVVIRRSSACHIWRTVNLHREFLRRVLADNMRESNPKCQIESVVTGDYGAPSVRIEYGQPS